MALYGAVRSAGEYVIAADNRVKTVTESVKTLDCILDGLAGLAPTDS